MVFVLALAAACGDDDDGDDAADATPTPVHWAYEGEAGPDNWGELSPDFAACAEGDEQSPIDLTPAEPQDLPDIVFDYEPSKLAIQNNGHTIQANYEPGSSISVGDESYELIQFHFHAHSEHTLDGESFPLEMHLVHRDDGGRLAVVGVMLEEGAANDAFEAVFENLPVEESEQAEAVDGATVDALQLLPTKKSYVAYQGSLTTPPCSEGVSWYVLSEPVKLSEDQIESFTEIFENNFRPTQPLGDREVLLDED